jgi:ribulose-phosphate 3-epimerase
MIHEFQDLDTAARVGPSDGMKRVVAPSILSADFGRLAEEVCAVETAGADWIHIDVMDGRFVPNITVGPAIVRAVRRATKLPLDVHLMIDAPEKHLAAFADAGADIITVHVEACPHLHRALQEIRSANARAGAAFNPATPIAALEHILDIVDVVLVMSVNPGFGGQSFIGAVVPKIEAARRIADKAGRPIDIEVDGGVTAETAALVAAAGANALVAGTAVFGAPDYAAAIRAIRMATGS